MLFRRSLPILAAAICCAAAVRAPAAHAADFTLRFASVNLAGTAAYERILMPFAKGVEQESDHRIEVALKPMGGYGKPAELFNITILPNWGVDAKNVPDVAAVHSSPCQMA